MKDINLEGKISALMQEHAKMLQAQGGVDSFLGLYHRESNKRVKAKIVKVSMSGKMVDFWCVADYVGKAIQWLPVYHGTNLDDNSEESKLWKLGYEQRAEIVLASSQLVWDDDFSFHIESSRRDGGIPAGAVVATP